MNIRFIVLCFVISCCMGCRSSHPKKSSQLRIVSMIPDVEATITIRGTGTSDYDRSFDLGYAQPVSYHGVSSGSYIFSYKVDGQSMLVRNYVIGSNGRYTLLVTGLKPKKIKNNPKTMMFRLEYMLAGSEAAGTNGFLPRWFMLRDNYDGSARKAYLRIINASPTYHKLGVRKDNKKYSRIVYPKKTDMKKLSAGVHVFSFYHGEILMGKTDIKAKPGYIYTLIVGDPLHASPDHLQLTVLSNRSRALLNKSR